MEENGSRVSETCEGGGSNDSIPNTEGLSPDSPDEAPKKRKAMQPRSDAWKHFEKYDDPSGAKRAKCNYCQKTYAAATKDWLRSEPIPIKVEEDLEYLEQLELDLADSAKDSTIIDI
uniref:BED-type domain-containing protein n=1 Tax=Nicotiana tabacum TaxID=4097 RepID=A0A1S4BI83_TOBAC|nr:PREDICTED: uncharacterized protein LOC107808576 [Nicotiana tabacum]